MHQRQRDRNQDGRDDLIAYFEAERIAASVGGDVLFEGVTREGTPVTATIAAAGGSQRAEAETSHAAAMESAPRLALTTPSPNPWRDETTVRLGPAKGKDFASSIGPWVVTPDELADARRSTGYDLEMTATVGAVEVSRGRWSDARFSFGQMLARASADAWLRPGDLLGSGTVGTGCLLEVREATLGRWFKER